MMTLSRLSLAQKLASVQLRSLHSGPSGLSMADTAGLCRGGSGSGCGAAVAVAAAAAAPAVTSSLYASISSWGDQRADAGSSRRRHLVIRPDLWTSNDRTLRFMSSSPSASSSAAAATKVERIPIPPNLHLDPRSSYAARVVVPAKSSTKSVSPPRSDDEDVRAAQEAGAEDDYESGDDDDDDDYGEDDFLSVLEREVAFVTPLPDRLKATVQDVRDGSEVGSIWLDSSVFGRDPIRIDLLKRAVDYHRAKKRGRRNAATKTISQVSGSGRKLRQQKGTGRARVGHGRPPHFRGGAKAHGPKNLTNYGNTKLNKKVRKQALCHALSQKLKENNVVLLNDLSVPSHKTSELYRILRKWNVGGDAGSSALVLDHYFPQGEGTENVESPPSFRGVPANLHVASRNIPKVAVGNANKASVYELLRKEKLILTLEALAVLERRLKGY